MGECEKNLCIHQGVRGQVGREIRGGELGSEK